ncbi:MAG: serine/threonine-protein kinase [Candidatus Promineifilaceae bacterium]|nr:serine/threonine-protein kinase [Candidatus Promineifilaceae bacterium]
MEDLSGKELGRYRIVAPCGEGGMAAVYKAFQPGTERYVALKILPRHFAREATFQERFQQEAQIIANFQHPHILPVFDYGEEDDYAYLAMPFIEGGTLAELINGGMVDYQRVRRIISQVGDALDYAHSYDVVHRDIKPTNILIDERQNALLTDFGISKIVGDLVNITATGQVIGTPAYMSPEQIKGEALDGRSDIYSLGIVLYEMVTGRTPYRADTPPALFVKHLLDPLPLPSALKPDIPPVVENVILKSLAKDRDDRYQTAADMVKAVQQAIDPAQTSWAPAAIPAAPARPNNEIVVDKTTVEFDETA